MSKRRKILEIVGTAVGAALGVLVIIFGSNSAAEREAREAVEQGLQDLRAVGLRYMDADPDNDPTLRELITATAELGPEVVGLIQALTEEDNE